MRCERKIHKWRSHDRRRRVVPLDRALAIHDGLWCEQVGPEETRLDERHLNAEALDLGRYRQRKPLESKLRSGVGARGRVANHARHRGHVKDAPRALASHDGECRPQDIQRTVEVRLELPLDLLCGQ